MKLEWDMWFRSPGCRHHMDINTLDGVSFTSIFYDGMRKVFLDEHHGTGVLYNGQLYQHAQDIVSANGQRYHFFVEDEETMLKYGRFKYGDASGQPPHVNPTMRIEGPDLPEDSDRKIWAKTVLNSNLVEFNFYHVISTAQRVKMKDATGAWVLLPAADRVPFAKFVFRGTHVARDDAPA